MVMAQVVACPICKTPSHPYDTGSDSSRFGCPRCGEFDIVRSLVSGLAGRLDAGIHRRALASHNLRRTQRTNSTRPLLTTANIESYWVDERLPPPQRQADDLILWVGDNQLSPDEFTRCSPSYLSAWLGTALLTAGAPTTAGLDWLCTYLVDEGLLEISPFINDPTYRFRLRMAGWRKYAELKQKNTVSQVAFMAMKFGDEELNSVVSRCFRPAVARTGFELRLLNEQQPAGIIDDQLRAALIASRFVICDLTHGNAGAYWEGGYAEGLGRPVIYTCRKTAWEVQKTHFDTNHLVTIIWDSSNLKLAEDQLAATIRATFRGDAKQAD